MADYGLPLMDGMMAQGVLEKNMFAFYMAMNQYDHSELTFGGYDESKFIGDIIWHPVADKLFWSIQLDDIKLNGIPLNICKGKKNCMLTPDSGTSLITTPSWAYDILIKKLPQQADCENKNGFGTLTFVINGIDYNIPSNHFMELYNDVYTTGDAYCMTSISPLDIYQSGQENLFIVGDAFMQIYYSIFDRDTDRVGLAKAREFKVEKQLASQNWHD